MARRNFLPMTQRILTPAVIRSLLGKAAQLRILVVGDVMLDQFVWGNVSRISPEAPVPVVEFERENFMPGGAANVARNLSAFQVRTELFGVVGRDRAAGEVSELLAAQQVNCRGLVKESGRATSIKTRIVAHQQQVVRVDRESRHDIQTRTARQLLANIEDRLRNADAVIVGDYGKGVVTQLLLDGLRDLCRRRGIWLSMDPKPVHSLNLQGLSLITPNRKETFELGGLTDTTRQSDPLRDTALMRAAESLLAKLQPALLLITLGELGMLLCERHRKPFHIPTVAQEVFDVSGAGDTVIATFTLAIAAGASPVEAAVFSNQAAGLVVGKVGTATVRPQELLRSFGG
jgi:D-glycero-beta-D-manno-heptose-7-phosphate kinase